MSSSSYSTSSCVVIVTVCILLLFMLVLLLVLLLARADTCLSWELTMALGLACAFPDAGLTVLQSEFLIVFTHYIDELYSTGASDVKLNISQHEVQSLRLRSTSIAMVGSIQQTKVKILLKVLFDSGSDKTIFKRSSSPQGIEPSTGKRCRVSGVNASSVTNQDVRHYSSRVVTTHSRSNSCNNHEHGCPI
jgi:hypothetical protein